MTSGAAEVAALVSRKPWQKGDSHPSTPSLWMGSVTGSFPIYGVMPTDGAPALLVASSGAICTDCHQAYGSALAPLPPTVSL